MTGRGFPLASGPVRAVPLLVGGAAGAWLLTVVSVPAGTLVGAVLGAALVNARLPVRVRTQGLPRAVRVAGVVLLGSAAGTQLGAGALGTLADIAAPLLGSVLALLALDAALAVWLVRRHGVDPLTAVLACAPGGVSEISVLATERGAELGLVLAVHSARVLAVVLLVLPILVTSLPA